MNLRAIRYTIESGIGLFNFRRMGVRVVANVTEAAELGRHLAKELCCPSRWGVVLCSGSTISPTCLTGKGRDRARLTLFLHTA